MVLKIKDDEKTRTKSPNKYAYICEFDSAETLAAACERLKSHSYFLISETKGLKVHISIKTLDLPAFGMANPAYYKVDKKPAFYREKVKEAIEKIINQNPTFIPRPDVARVKVTAANFKYNIEIELSSKSAGQIQDILRKLESSFDVPVERAKKPVKIFVNQEPFFTGNITVELIEQLVDQLNITAIDGNEDRRLKLKTFIIDLLDESQISRDECSIIITSYKINLEQKPVIKPISNKPKQASADISPKLSTEEIALQKAGQIRKSLVNSLKSTAGQTPCATKYCVRLVVTTHNKNFLVFMGGGPDKNDLISERLVHNLCARKIKRDVTRELNYIVFEIDNDLTASIKLCMAATVVNGHKLKAEKPEVTFESFLAAAQTQVKLTPGADDGFSAFGRYALGMLKDPYGEKTTIANPGLKLSEAQGFYELRVPQGYKDDIIPHRIAQEIFGLVHRSR